MPSKKRARRVNPFNLGTNEGKVRSAIQPARAYFGCGARGIDPDEYDPTVQLHAEYPEERVARERGLYCIDPEDAPDQVNKANQKRKAKKKRYKANRKTRVELWRMEQQAKW